MACNNMLCFGVNAQRKAGESDAGDVSRSKPGLYQAGEVIADDDERGLKRAISRPLDAEFARHNEYRRCHIRDWSAPDQPALNFREMGFESISLAQRTAADAARTHSGRREKSHPRSPPVAPPPAWQRVSGWRTARPQAAACRAGGLIMQGRAERFEGRSGCRHGEMNGHDVAINVHGDQDVRGTPLKQIMRGFAPWMFRHKTPGGSNRISPLVLVNLWIPLQQITRPLALMDRRTLNAREHQLRYALPTESLSGQDRGDAHERYLDVPA
ncbi:MAG: hypothetical protein IPG64_13695 [Haliea sp.]|nr:hypothetical protein [Haliea sp.]